MSIVGLKGSSVTNPLARSIVAYWLVAIATACSAPVTSTPSPSPVVADSPTPTVIASPPIATRPAFTPPVQAPALAGVAARPTQLPREFRLMQLDSFAEATQVQKVRLIALDLTGANAHVEIASWEVPTRVATSTWSASADGRRVAVIAAGGTGLIAALYLIDVPTGGVRKLYEDPEITPASPILSPDGTLIASLRLPRQNTASYQVQLGVWAGATERPESWARIVEQTKPPGTEAASTIVPIAWSADARWFAYARTFIAGEVFVVAREGGTEVKAGDGFQARWHPAAARLVIFGAGYASAPALTTFDLDTKTSRTLATGSAGDPPRRFVSGVWAPDGDRIAFAEGDPLSSGTMPVSTISADGTARTRIADASPELQWSKDGAALYSWGWSNQFAREFRVTDLISGNLIARGCSNGPISADPCP